MSHIFAFINQDNLLLHALTDGNPVSMDALKRYSVVEYYNFIAIEQARRENQRKELDKMRARR